MHNKIVLKNIEKGREREGKEGRVAGGGEQSMW